MIGIYILGTNESGFLDVPLNLKLNVEVESAMFDEQLTASEFTLPFVIPITAFNKRLLGFAEVLENGINKIYNYTCHLYVDGMPYINYGTLTILQTKMNNQNADGTYHVSVSGSLGTLGNKIKNKTLKDLRLFGTIEFGTDSRTYATNVMKGNIVQNEIAFAPLAIAGFFDTNRNDYDNEFLVKDTVNYVVVTGNGTNDWEFGRPSSSNANVAVTSGNADYIDYRTIPFLQVKYVLRKCFEEFGFNIQGELMSSNDWNDLYMYNNRAIEDYAPSIQQDNNRKIKASNHVPEIPINEFIINTLKFFKLYPVITANSVILKNKNVAANASNVVSISKYITDGYTTEKIEKQTNEVINVAYTLDNTDAYFSENVKNIKDKTLIATVATEADLASIITPGLTTDAIAYVIATNMYYNISNSTTLPYLWNAWSDGLQSNENENSNTINIGATTMAQYIKYDNNAGLWFRENYLACRQIGSYNNNQGTLVTSPYGLRFFYIGKQNLGNGTMQPVSYNHNLSATGTVLQKYSLALQTNNSISKLHKDWQSILLNMEIIKLSGMLNYSLLELLQNNSLFEINNIVYLLKGMQHQLPIIGEIELELVPI